MLRKSGLFLVALFGTLALADADSQPRSCNENNEVVAQDCNNCTCTNDCMPCEAQKSCCDNKVTADQVEQIKYNVSVFIGDREQKGEIIVKSYENVNVDMPQELISAKVIQKIDNNITVNFTVYRKMEDGNLVEHSSSSVDSVWGQAVAFECPETTARIVLTATQA